jgi:2,4-dienoyl-CoA reductase-like NADH-dependent reductase (Old Yellow Enzyme family)
MAQKYRRMASFKTAEAFQEYLTQLNINLPFDEEIETGPNAPLAQAHNLKSGSSVGNRFAVLPMEGWDSDETGRPTDLTARRWQNFGKSGAKLIWGGEATAVRHDGRANPNQLMIIEETADSMASLRQALVDAHEETFGDTSDLLVGLQLTHAGRFSRPNEKSRLEPSILYNHPLLNPKFNLPTDTPLMNDDAIKRLIDDFVHAACLSQQAGFNFVDIKHCHGYLGHEFLSAITRGGEYGGSFENRTRFLREIVAGIRAEAPDLQIGVRLSAFDFVPFRTGPDEKGQPEPVDGDNYPFAFGGDGTGTGIDLSEAYAFLDLLKTLGIELACISAGSPYYNPHLVRPALFPPSDGYQPPEDPLVGVARHLAITAKLKQHQPDLTIIGSGYSYLQEWLPNVAQSAVRTGRVDFAGIGRMMLTYPDLVADTLTGEQLQRRRICRTFSDCTTAPRNGMVSGCYPLDPFYKERPEAATVAAIKKAMRK